MTNELTRRLEALERRLNADRPSGLLPPGGPLRVTTISGCLPPGEPLFAVAGALEWLREPGEGLDAFADRARAGALAAGEALLTIGGLPVNQVQQDLALAAYDAWALTDDGVPPCEQPRGLPVIAR
jgi:hypothetical protein